jgi:hypothetical protein
MFIRCVAKSVNPITTIEMVGSPASAAEIPFSPQGGAGAPVHGGMTVWPEGPVTAAVAPDGSVQHVVGSNRTGPGCARGQP